MAVGTGPNTMLILGNVIEAPKIHPFGKQRYHLIRDFRDQPAVNSVRYRIKLRYDLHSKDMISIQEDKCKRSSFTKPKSGNLNVKRPSLIEIVRCDE